MPPEHNQKPFWLYKIFSKHVSVWCQKKHLHCTISWCPELHSWSTLKANVCIFLYITVRKLLLQRRRKILSDRGWVGGRLVFYIFRCLDLVKCFTIFLKFFEIQPFFSILILQFIALRYWNFLTIWSSGVRLLLNFS